MRLLGIVNIGLCLTVLTLTDCGPPPVVDVTAADLTVEPTIADVDPAPWDGKLLVAVQFLEGGSVVQLALSNTVTCNGVVLIWNGLLRGYIERVPLVGPGGSYAITHMGAGVTTQINVPVPPRPALTSPSPGASLPRTANLMIDYVAASSAGVLPSATGGIISISGAEQPDTGVATLDVTALPVGPGTVGVLRRIVSSPSNTGFGSVTATYTISSVDTHVTWQ